MKSIVISLVLLLVNNWEFKKSYDFKTNKVKEMESEKSNEIAIFAGGCFWCTEAVFLQLEGVESVLPGYIGGKEANPTYEEVCSGYSGHAEAVKFVFDPNKISYEDLLDVFFATHDPTTINRQGADVGSQYRSEIFCTTESQMVKAKLYLENLTLKNTFDKKVVTKISNATEFYVAENYHLNYYNQNKEKSYCSYVITPKIDKLKKEFKAKLKK